MAARTRRAGRGGITLLWIEDCPEWAAAGNHLRGTLRRLKSQGIPVRAVLARSGGSSTGGRFPFLAKLGRITGLVGRGIVCARRDLLLARWHPFIYPVLVAWHLRGGKVVLLVQGNLADLHSSNPWTRRVPLIGAMARRSLLKADAIVTPSPGLARWVEAETGRPAESMTVLPNGVDVAGFAPGTAATDARGRKPAYAIFVGNFASWQGIDTILAAFRHPSWPREISLRFIGDGQDRHLVERAGTEGVSWLGRQPRDVVSRELSGAFVSLATRKLVGASATGVSPFKVIESAAAGIPVIATRVPGQTELVNDLGGGVLVDADDPAAVASAVGRLWAEPDAWLGLSEAGSRAVLRYDWAAEGPRLAGVIRRNRGRR